MSEYIGSRISLISKRDIRYVGTLHEINSESSTVALERVKSYGTEGRSEEEVPPSENVYEYIVFRGSDVKDLRIEKEPEKKPQPPQVPDDPAILGNARPVGPPSALSQPSMRSPPPPPPPQQQQQLPPPPYSPQQGRSHPPRYPQHSPYPYGGYPPPPNQRLGLHVAPQGYPLQGYPGIQYGPPPGWYPPPGQGFPHGPPGQMMAPRVQHGFPGQPPQQPGPASQSATPAQDGIEHSSIPPQPTGPIEKPAAAVKLPTPAVAKAQIPQGGPPPPTSSKPNIDAALAPSGQPAPQGPTEARPQPTAQRSGHIQPAIPIKSPVAKQKVPAISAAQSLASATPKNPPVPTTVKTAAPAPPAAAVATRPSNKTVEEANRDARAAVAAAMAKLGPAPGQQKQPERDGTVMDNLTKKVNEMRTHDNFRNSAERGYGRGRGGARGGYRNGRPRTESQTKKIEVPKEDYDFNSANAKFNKQDLVKEAIASGNPVGSPVNGTPDGLTDGALEESENQLSSAGYNKTSSFFDNISSESRDRDESKKLGGREFRSEERQKNMETFGQGSVDSFRGGYRGRGRGRGRARGGYSRGRGGAMRGRGGIVAAES